MTRERRLAVQMWREIAKKIRSVEYVGVKQEKVRFCVSHNLVWSYNCWFCQYMRNCDECRLEKIGGACITQLSLYQCSIYGETREVRARAAETIAKILNGDSVSQKEVNSVICRRRLV